MNPILLDFGFLEIRYYGLMYALALLIAFQMVEKDSQFLRLGLSQDQSATVVTLTFIFGLIGARLYYVAFSLDYYFAPNVDWYEFIKVWQGGLAIHGGILGGMVGMYVSARQYQTTYTQITDLCAPPLLLGQALGRIGNFMNGDAHGLPTEKPWGIVFPYGPAAAEFPGLPLHPVMLYEAVLNLTGFFVLFALRRKGYRVGLVSALYLIFYSIIRFFVTSFRADDLYIFSLRAPQVISVIGLLIGLIWLFGGKLWQKRY